MPIRQPRPAAQYLRMSTDHQRYSLGNQAAFIERYAAEHGFAIIRSYEDAGRSGVTTRRRDGLKALLADVLSGAAPFAVVLVVDVTRWGRFQDPDEAGHYEFICREAGVRVVYCDESFGDDLGGVIVKQIRRVMAGEYSRDLSQKVQFGLRRAALQGRRCGGGVPYGFRRVSVNADGTRAAVLASGERKSRVDQTVKVMWGPPNEVATVRLIFRLYVFEKLTPAMIAQRLRDEGRVWKSGAPWGHHNVVATLTNEMALGIAVFNKTSSVLGSRSGAHPREQWIRKRVCSPIISTKLFNMAQVRRAELRGRRRTDEEMLEALRGLLRRRGRLSHTDIDMEPGMASAYRYWERFGSLTRAYQLIGYDSGRRRDPRETKQSREAIVRGLQRLHGEEGGINAALINSDQRIPSAQSIRHTFGSLRQLYMEAGFEQSRKGWRARTAAGAIPTKRG